MKTRFFYAPRYCEGTKGEVTGTEALALADVEAVAWEYCADYGKPLDPMFKLAIGKGANAIVYSVTRISLDMVAVEDLITRHRYRIPVKVWSEAEGSDFSEWSIGKLFQYAIERGQWSHKLRRFVAPDEFNPDFAR